MQVWKGENLNSGDREAALSKLSEETVDAEFVPYLRQINALPFVVTAQCCVGHMPYDAFPGPREELPPNRTTRWGYLQLFTTLEAAEWLSESADWDWLWHAGSQLFIEGCGWPEVTENESYSIAFAWDATAWPGPASDIIKLLDDFYEHHCVNEYPRAPR
jgi:hypothetical protein